ncbi:iron-containing redox enzyme family protein [Sorangium sp. So ce1151]|uniref:iron-containing redox enzyme family protein n=1 Tax=Sorangium sp. So ce1151 TaxID=3133332 RepID=UPI003F6062F5
MDYFKQTLQEMAPVQASLVERHPMLERIRNGTFTRANYAAYLVEQYHLVTQTPHYLTAAAAQCRTDQWLRDWFLDLAQKERGHDKLCVHDLKKIGADPDALLARHPGLGAWTMVTQNHFLADRVNPAGLLGFAAATENLGAALATGVAVHLETKCQFTRGATSFLRVHGQEDQDHVEDVKQAYNHGAERPENRQLMSDIWRMTLLAYAQLFTDVLDRGDTWLG